MQQHLISFLIFLPLGAALLSLLVHAERTNFFRFLALAVSLVQVFILIFIFQAYEASDSAFRLVEKTSWITLHLGTWGSFHAEYFVGLDGLSLLMVFLSVVITLIAA
ncbi:MAG TPA: hypothetical protein VFE57_07125, partial [Cyclobacteriaceae bacterium]|nr:hypothetical protein [Cyclobacteriaceae bacterium]